MDYNEPAINILEKLISFRTTAQGDGHRASYDYIANYFDEYGIKPEIFVSESNSELQNIWATLPASNGNTNGGIILSGHTDVVDVDGQQWTSDPFVMRIEDDKAYGRGACDMKGFNACAMALLPDLLNIERAFPIHFSFTHSEEVGLIGVQELLPHIKDRAKDIKACIVGEPTLCVPVEAHKGFTGYHITVTGTPGHSSRAPYGVNPITILSQLVTKLDEKATERQSKPFPGSNFDPPYTTINPGILRGGSGTNSIPAQAELKFEYRLHPGDDDQDLRTLIKDHFDQIELNKPMGTGVFDIDEYCNDPELSKEDSDFFDQIFQDQTRQSVTYCTEAGFYQSIGIPCMVFGPGSIDQAHQGDEYIEISQIGKYMHFMRTRFLDAVKLK